MSYIRTESKEKMNTDYEILFKLMIKPNNLGYLG